MEDINIVNQPAINCFFETKHKNKQIQFKFLESIEVTCGANFTIQKLQLTSVFPLIVSYEFDDRKKNQNVSYFRNVHFEELT